jgi:CDP-diacylglycerol--serine O-phosphatidyltransferase
MIEFAILCDASGSLVARISHSASRFGIEYESLADLVAFGVAPAALAYSWALRPVSRQIGLAEAGLLRSLQGVAPGAVQLQRRGPSAALRWSADTRRSSGRCRPLLSGA